MLTKIRIDQLRLGMHLHELCGTWFDHPFWRSKFVLRNARDLEKLRASGVKECWIDTAKGLGVPLPDRPPTPTRYVRTATARKRPATPAAAAPLTAASNSLEDEAVRAAALCHQGRETVAALIDDVRLGRALDAQRCLPLVQEVTDSVWRNPGALTSLLRLKTHDDYSYMHSVAVCALMVSLGAEARAGRGQARGAGMAGLLHDMGKAVMPLDVLNKPGKLNDAEYDLCKTILGADTNCSRGQRREIALDVCLHHHEKPDGKGYPTA